MKERKKMKWRKMSFPQNFWIENKYEAHIPLKKINDSQKKWKERKHSKNEINIKLKQNNSNKAKAKSLSETNKY